MNEIIDMQMSWDPVSPLHLPVIYESIFTVVNFLTLGLHAIAQGQKFWHQNFVIHFQLIYFKMFIS